MYIPKVYQGFRENWFLNQYSLCEKYESHQYSFIPNLLPEEAIHLTTPQVIEILQKRFGKNLQEALKIESTIKSPVTKHTNGNWLKTTNMVGINIRTIGSFWNLVKYALTIPQAQQSIHILPIWEPGVVGSLYGISSWQINKEFYSEELTQTFPHLDTVEKQLKVVINILHLMGKSVGMDVIPHTDRFSQITIANPHHFEWLQRSDVEIVDHSANLHKEVQTTILNFVKRVGSATSGQDFPKDVDSFFYTFPESDRNKVLFGIPDDLEKRNKRRNEIIHYLYNHGYEPVPATMAPPYRGIVVDVADEAKTIDGDGRIWRDYKITNPQAMSRVFGPLTRYKLYERKKDNQDWEIDFEKPRTTTWEYVATQYHKIQSSYNFDFMRGDMSHVQMRPKGVPHQVDDYYDLLKYIKTTIQQEQPYFGYFAETFLAPTDEMAYGNEIDHLELSAAESTLGDLQSLPINTPEFSQHFRRYCDILATRTVIPNFTVMTADKDDPRFDKFYLHGNITRLFIGLFLGDMPSYMGMGFECRDIHHHPAPNEHYTKLYVFQISEGAKATTTPYKWGKNGGLYHKITRLKLYVDQLLSDIEGMKTKWVLSPDATGNRKVIAWTQQENTQYLFVANLDNASIKNIKLPAFSTSTLMSLQLVYSTIKEKQETITFNGIHWQIDELKGGEGRVYQKK